MAEEGKLKTLPRHIWPVSDWPIARLTVRLPIIADANDLTLDNWEEDGLGPATNCVFRLPSGIVVLLQELEHLIGRSLAKGPDVYADAGDVEKLGIDEILDETLLALGLKASDVDLRMSPPEEGDVDRMKIAVEQVRRRRAERAATIERDTRWAVVEQHDVQLALQAELSAELSEKHPLFGRAATAVARSRDRDDVLFELYGGQMAEVHLTWRGAKEHDPRWPKTIFFTSIAEWIAARKVTGEEDVQ